jgi:uncharacterized membrane protein
MKIRKFWLKAIDIIGAVSLGLSTSFLTIPAPALAQFRTRQICNKTGFGLVSIALGYQDGVSKGWYNIWPGQCLKTIFRDLRLNK